jgi:hypothetical protein
VAIRTAQGHFTDVYSPEFSSDIEPVSSLFADLYLQKMKQQIQQFKRNSPSLYFYDASAGKWYLKEGRGWQQLGNVNFTHTVSWPNDNHYQPIVGDFNDDGTTDIGVRQPDTGVWHFALADGHGNYSNTRDFTWAGDSAGLTSFQPIVGDFNDDGKTDIGLRRRDTGVWYFAFSDGHGNYTNSRNFTWAVDSSSKVMFQPIVGDFDCDGKTDIGLRRTDNGINYLANFDGNSAYSNYFNNNYTWRKGAQYLALSKPAQCMKP